MNRFEILIGSNTDARSHIEWAINALQIELGEAIRFSEALQSRALHSDGSLKEGASDYLNVLCIGHTSLEMESVRQALKEMERHTHRQRGMEANGRVTLDLDLVWWNEQLLRPKEVNMPYYRNCRDNLESRPD
jgi:2-amino-4-hydroxy-6-hydroxymethyldihydropteridine diphosphokinase